MVTWELAEFREALESALGLPTLPSHYASRDHLQQRLDAVVAEQEERLRIRHAKPESADA